MRRPVRWFLATVLAGVAAGAAAHVGRAHPPAQLSTEQENATVEEVKAFRQAVVDVIAAKDVARLRAMYADSFRHAHGSGKVDGRDARIVSVLAGDPVIETAAVTELEIRIPGGWTAIATGVSPLPSLADGKTYEFRWIAVYVRVGDSWQIAASQATRLGEVKP